MTSTTTAFYREYDLKRARSHGEPREPSAHQNDALVRLSDWFDSMPTGPRGGLLVLPTGGGKTFTAVRHLCRLPLSRGYKVLWLAHTHHLLEQALDAFGALDGAGGRRPEVANVEEPKEHLRVRVVSGTPGHCNPHQIAPEDDVLIGTVQTLSRAFAAKHPRLEAFLRAAAGKLYVVFDEAHHAPAPSYARFITKLREQIPEMRLLGLTATPVYADESRRGWLPKLFPQELLYKVSPSHLMASGILARPQVEEPRTKVVPEFDPVSFQRWSMTYQDLPEDLISQLANSRARNDFIAATYIANRARYGKTIIFADRWFQCDYLRESLTKAGVRAEVVYSHVDADPGSAEARNRRARGDNARVIDAFRKDELDVLVNVRMLTEGTDVPNVQTVFITRQTTSRVLLTQMVGRALRGPAFGGTDEANIVLFIDDWKQAINWAEYGELEGGGVADDVEKYGKKPPLQLISIELVRRLARDMQTGSITGDVPFLKLLPLGWYRVEFQTVVDGKDDTEWVRELVLVFDRDKAGYDALIDHLRSVDLEPYAEPNLALSDVHETAKDWAAKFLEQVPEDAAVRHSFDLLRHLAQNQGEAPRFFAFEQRNEHDLDALARGVIEKNLGIVDVDAMLQAEYERTDRFWRSLYLTYDSFHSQFMLVIRKCSRGRSGAQKDGADVAESLVRTPEALAVREPSEDVKAAVKRRDGMKCLCCGSTTRLQIDHIAPFYLSGDSDERNLQTLCDRCNRDKGIRELNFTIHTLRGNGKHTFVHFELPRTQEARDVDAWERYLRRTVNFFYGCAAVDTVDIGKKGDRFYNWHVRLYPGNDPELVQPHAEDLAAQIQKVREQAGTKGPSRIEFSASR